MRRDYRALRTGPTPLDGTCSASRLPRRSHHDEPYHRVVKFYVWLAGVFPGSMMPYRTILRWLGLAVFIVLAALVPLVEGNGLATVGLLVVAVVGGLVFASATLAGLETESE